MNIVKTCVLRPFSYTFGFDFGLFYENKNFLEVSGSAFIPCIIKKQ